ncbi:MAG: hypothetical protein WDW38_001044 [Sanguina aurantia]
MLNMNTSRIRSAPRHHASSTPPLHLSRQVITSATDSAAVTRNGYAVMEAKGALTKFSYQLPAKLGANEVDIRTTHNGVCGSDLSMQSNGWGLSKYPFIPGHEVVGTVEGLGSSVSGLKIGQRVGVGWIKDSCRCCPSCMRGDENLCAEGYTGTIVMGNHGGFQDVMRCPADFAYPIPEALASSSAAPLLCAGATVYAPLKRHMTRPGMRVAIMGVGGLGHLAIQFAAKMGAEVTAIDVFPEKEAEAKRLGAKNFIAWVDSSAALPSAAGFLGFDVLLNCASRGADTGKLLDTLANNGTIVQANDAHEAVRSGTVRYRVVLVSPTNSSGMDGGEEDDWGLDDIEVYAQARGLRDGDDEESVSGGGSSSNGRVKLSRGSAKAAAPAETSGLWVDPLNSKSVVLDEAYARHNPSMVQALKRLGKTAMIQKEEEWDDNDDGSSSSSSDTRSGGGSSGLASPASDRQRRRGGNSSSTAPDDSSSSLQSSSAAAATPKSRRSQLVEFDEYDPPAARGSSSNKRGSLTDPAPNSSASSGSGSSGDNWMAGLESAGFSVGRSGGAGGAVYFERTSSEPPAARRQPKPITTIPTPPAGPTATPSKLLKLTAVSTGTPSPLPAPPPPRSGGAAPGQPVKPAPPLAVSTAAAVAVAPPVKAGDAHKIAGPTHGLAEALLCVESSDQVSTLLEVAFPRWAGNNCRMLVPGSSIQVSDTPSPEDAVSALRRFATLARAEGMGSQARLSLAADRHVAGLVECLRVSPPRTVDLDPGSDESPSSDAASVASERGIASAAASAAMFAAARLYWGAVIGGRSIGEPLSKAAAKAAAAAKGRAAGGRGSGAWDSDYGRILERYSGSESSTVEAGVGAAAAAVSASAAAAKEAGGGSSGGSGRLAKSRQETVMGALWALSMLGGPAYFSTEMDALLSIAPWGQMAITPRQASNLMWALANARHSNPRRLAAIEEGLVKSGGFASFEPYYLSKVLWGFASLAYTPQTLLHTLSPTWEGPRPPTPNNSQPSTSAPGSSKASTAAAAAAAVAKSVAAAMALAASQNSAAAAAAAGPKKKAGTLTVVMTGSKTALGAGSKLAASGPTPAAGSGMAAASRKGGLFYWGSKDLASAAWAMSVMGQTNSAPFVSMWAEMLARGEGLKGEGEVALTQVWQVAMAVKLEASWAKAAAPGSSSSDSSSSSSSSSTPHSPPLTTPHHKHHPHHPAAAGAAPAAIPAPASDGSSSPETSEPANTSSSSTSTSSSTSSTPMPSSSSSGSSRDSSVSALALTRTPLLVTLSSGRGGKGGGGSSGGAEPAYSAAATALLAAAEKSFLGQTSALRQKVHSSYQRQMANSLTAMKMMHMLEDTSSGYAIDITLPSLRIAIEADGPTHLSRNAPHRVLGGTLLKARHLRALGWKLLNITFTEWDALSSETARVAFLQQKIDAILLDALEVSTQGSAGEGRAAAVSRLQ